MHRQRTQHIDEKTRISTKGWSLDSLISSSRNFYPVDRVPASSSELSQLIKDHERNGLPLVVEGFHRHNSWPTKMFTLEGFEEHSKSSDISVRNVHSWTDKVMGLSDFVLKSRSVGPFAEEGELERFYGKDAECPHAWDKWLQESNVLPSSILSHGSEDEFRFRPASSRIETLMCYLGIGDTYTPCHKDLCASSGHNLMCYTDNNGSSFWFMTEGSDARKVAAYFHELGRELDHENHVITLKQLELAPFKVYILEQGLGDLVLVPPRSCHQVVNYGGITIKTSWSRMTLEGLSTAYHHELPIYRRVCRPETYRIKGTIYYALTSRIRELDAQLSSQLPASSSGLPFSQVLVNATSSSALKQMPRIHYTELDSLAKNLMKLLDLYNLILEEEKPRLELPTRQQQELNDDSRIVCDFCECDIFQSFFECSGCTVVSSGSHTVCPGCYSEGRTCTCETMQPMQCRKFQGLIDTRTEAVDVLRRYSERTGGNLIHFNNQHEENAPRLFQAACGIFQARKDKRTTRICSKLCGQYLSHEIPFDWGLYCLHCHRSTCFEHSLRHFKMHSAEAILLFDGDKTRNRYHQQHQLSSTRYETILPDLEKSQKDGTPTDGLALLVYIISQYGHCVPSNPNSLKSGWYDTVPQEGEPSHSNGLEETARQPRLTITIPAMQPREGRRQVYVDVPPAPYLIPHKRCQTSSSDYAIKSSDDIHPPPSEPPKASPSTTRGPKTHSPLRRHVEKNSEFPTNFKGKQILPTPDLASSSALPASAVTAKRTPRSPQHAKRAQHKPLSPQKYLESQAAKKAVYNQLHFRKKPVPDENSSAMISDENVNLDPPLSSPQQDVYPHHPPTQAILPKDSVLEILELFNAVGGPAGPDSGFHSHHNIPSSSLHRGANR